MPDRDVVDAARWTAYEEVNEYLAKQRAARAPRRPTDPTPPNGKLLHDVEGFRYFGSMEDAIQEVTREVLGVDSTRQPGRERSADVAEVGLRLAALPWGLCKIMLGHVVVLPLLRVGGS